MPVKGVRHGRGSAAEQGALARKKWEEVHRNRGEYRGDLPDRRPGSYDDEYDDGDEVSSSGGGGYSRRRDQEWDDDVNDRRSRRSRSGRSSLDSERDRHSQGHGATAPGGRSAKSSRDSDVSSTKGGASDQRSRSGKSSKDSDAASEDGHADEYVPRSRRSRRAERGIRSIKEEKEEDDNAPPSPREQEKGQNLERKRSPRIPVPAICEDDLRDDTSDKTHVQSSGENTTSRESPRRSKLAKPSRTMTPLPAGQKRVYPLSGIDNLAFLMENDSYHPACFSVYLFKTVIERETIVEFFHRLAQEYPKYRYVVELDPSQAAKKDKAAATQSDHYDEKHTGSTHRSFDAGRKTSYAKGIKAGGPFRPAKWRFDPTFDIEENIFETRCPSPGDEGALFKVAGDFLARHFNYSKPLWEALIVNDGLNSTRDGARSAVMIKIHHAFSDGQGMIQTYHAALGALSSGKSIAEVQKMYDSSIHVKKPGQRDIKPTLGGTVKHAWHTTRGLYFRSRKSFQYSNPSAPRVTGRHYCHSDGISMDDIKLIRKAFSSDDLKLSLNDVACTILSRALRIAAERTEPDGRVKDKRVAIFVPISRRPKGNWDLANYTTGGIAWFAFHDPKDVSFEQQLAQVNREMGRIKRSHLPAIWFKTFDFWCKSRLFYLPNYPVFRGIFQTAFREYSVATNVPGPPHTIKFGEHEAYSYHVMPPSSPGKSTLAIGMISYGGSFSVAVSCDQRPEFERLTQEVCVAFQDAAKEITRAARVKLGASEEK